MSSKIQVIGGLYDQLNKARKETPESNHAPESSGKHLSEKTCRALAQRREEYLRLCKDLQTKHCELNAVFTKQEKQLSERLEVLHSTLKQLDDASQKIRELPAVEENEENYQSRLSDACREAEQLRFSLIEAAAQLEEDHGQNDKNPVNFFADMNSLSFGQLCRTGFALALPVMLTIFLTMLILGAAIVLTFRGF